MRRIVQCVVALGLAFGGASVVSSTNRSAFAQVGPGTFEMHETVGGQDHVVAAVQVTAGGPSTNAEQWIVRNDHAFPLDVATALRLVRAPVQFPTPEAFQAAYRSALAHDPGTPLDTSDDDPDLYGSTFVWGSQEWANQ